MIKKIQLQNFTAFQRAELTFCPGLNAIIGENGTGKTHLLKLGYLFNNCWPRLMKPGQTLGRQRVEEYLAKRFKELFRPLKIGNLSHSEGDGKTVVIADVEGTIPTIHIHMPHEQPGRDLPEPMGWEVRFSRRSEKNVTAEQWPEEAASNAFVQSSVYIPTKEIISFFNGFKEVARKYSLQFDETYLDLADNLSLPPLKEKPQLLQKQMRELGEVIGGDVLLKNGQFFLRQSKKNKLEISLVAEGLRKIATILHLINNGSLEQGGTLFWDEPEANLNPRLVKLMARSIYSMAAQGTQVVLATHSLFLLRELELLGRQEPYRNTGRCFFALGKTTLGVEVRQGSSLDDIDPIVMLDEELEQSDRYLETI